ncbi:uncharacterized protein LOC110464430 [Mizuhopecten yessoensis]|uniref:Uncharacterized protein n=1 Tax=Mizuhopecten yessoensis TaxID=6573 RepID=A0A210PTY5_MIZYE|nr:uncharacterized protein LOC110464430 [Mizuhopecten yessoensis]OWF39961.1 hypothetical protein KP79_PYT04293 [Mizuhopecten yessoensis]
MTQGTSLLLVVFANFFVVQCYGSYLPGALGLSKSNEASNYIDSVITEEEKAFYAKVIQRLMDRAAALEEEVDGHNGDNFDSDADLSSSSDLSGLKRSMDKRKVFWQPLGYVPASMRMSPNNKHKASQKDVGRKGFRYGK